MEEMRDSLVNRTRKPQVSPRVPSPKDIAELLAAICKIEQLDQLQIPAHRVELENPANSPTQAPRRFAEVLDSLATLGVSQVQHEVIATGLRVDDRRKSIEIIVATNTNVHPATSKHIKDMWEFMTRLSDRFYQLHPDGMPRESPKTKPNDPLFKNVYRRFAQRCFDFSFKRLQKKVNGKFAKLMAIDITGLGPEHPFVLVRESIQALQSAYTREQNSLYGRPKPQDHDSWDLFHLCLQNVKQKIKTFLDAGGFQCQGDAARIMSFIKLNTYLRKISTFANCFEILVNTAMSPRCRRLFSYGFTLTTLPEMATKLPSIAQTEKDWENVLDMAVAYNNINGKIAPRLLDVGVIGHHTALMAKGAITRSLNVHCEIKLLTAIHRTQEVQPTIPKAYTYIGVSKLSCNGCDSFIKAFNNVNATRWVTKGCHGKSYYPWMFPQPFPSHDAVLVFMYSIMVERWVNSYRGYTVSSIPFEPDSTDQSSREVEAPSDVITDDADNKLQALFNDVKRDHAGSG